MICLYCKKDAEHLEDYDGIPIGVCVDGHRTGLDLRPALEIPDGLEVVKVDWDEAEKMLWEQLKKAS